MGFEDSLIPYANYIPRCPHCGKMMNQEYDIIDYILSWAKDEMMSNASINRGVLLISYKPRFEIQCSLLYNKEGRIIEITRELYLQNAFDIETVQMIIPNDFTESHKVRIAELCREDNDIMVQIKL